MSTSVHDEYHLSPGTSVSYLLGAAMNELQDVAPGGRCAREGLNMSSQTADLLIRKEHRLEPG